MTLSSKQSYFFRGMYEWILDNGLTPHIVVNTHFPEVNVPPKYIENNQITLNLAPSAVTGFAMNNEALEFKASFGGRLLHLYIPIGSITAVYALENSHCLLFGPEEITKGMIVNMQENPENPSPERTVAKPPKKAPPKLTIVK